MLTLLLNKQTPGRVRWLRPPDPAVPGYIILETWTDWTRSCSTSWTSTTLLLRLCQLELSYRLLFLNFMKAFSVNQGATNPLLLNFVIAKETQHRAY